MIEIGLAVGASVGWGASEFVAGVASRRRSMVVVLAGSQVASLLIVAVMVALAGFQAPAGDAFPLALAAGVFEVLGVAALYQALASGPMGPVAPVAALGGLVPLSVSLAGGTTLAAAPAAGIVLGLAGVLLVSWERDGRGMPRATTGPLILAGAASLCFGMYFLLLQRATVEGEALGVVAVSRVAAVVVTLAVLHLASRGRGDPSGRLGPRAREGSARQQARLVGAVALIGLLDIGASLLYALGTSRSDDVGLQIIASACPVATVLLAQIVLRERMNRIQTAGVWLTIGAVLLIGGG